MWPPDEPGELFDEPAGLDDDRDEGAAEGGTRAWETPGDPLIDATVVVALQFGNGNTSVVNINPPSDRPKAPERMGQVPRGADCYQHRSASKRIAEAFQAPGTQILTGLGGVGKTQLAARCAEQALASKEIELLIWAAADSEESIRASYEQAARAHAGFEGNDPRQAASWFLDWLRGTGKRWLVVLDDLVSPRDLNELWPPRTPTGRTIITTRRTVPSLAREGVVEVQVGGFTPAESRSYLEAKLAGEPKLADDLGGLAEDFENLPLGLAMAASYMLARKTPASAYREKLAGSDDPSQYLLNDDEPPDFYQGTLAAILNLDLADSLKPTGLASPLLVLLSLLASSGIPQSVLTSTAVVGYLREQRTATAGAPVTAESVREALHLLRDLHLIQPNADTASVRVHSVVRRWARAKATVPEVLGAAFTAAADGLVEAWPEFETDAALAQALRDNTAALARDSGWETAMTAHPLLGRMGRSLAASGDPAGAVPYYEKLLAGRAEILGPDDPGTHEARAGLASCHGRSGDVTRAIEGFTELFADQSKVLAPDDPVLLGTRSRLASWYGRAGYVAHALREFRYLAEARALASGPNSPETWRTRASLATWQSSSRDHASAEATLTQLLSDQVDSLGAVHPVTLGTRAALGAARGRGGNLEAARRAHEDLLADLTRVCGPDHPDTFRARVMRARWRGWAGDEEGAVTELRALLREQCASLGPDHPAIRGTRRDVMTWQLRAPDPGAGAVEDALAQLDSHIRELGPYHPDTLATRDALCQVRYATPYSPLIVAGLEKLIAAQNEAAATGRLHLEALSTRLLLAQWHGMRGRRAAAREAAEAVREVLAGRLRILGPDHEHALTTRIWLVRLLARARDHPAAAREQEIVIAEHQRLYGDDHPAGLDLLDRAVQRQHSAGHVVATHTALTRLHHAQEKILDSDAAETLRTRFRIARWIGQAGNAEHAASLHERLLTDRLSALGTDHEDTLTSQWHTAYWRRKNGDQPGSLAALNDLLAAQRRLHESGHADFVESGHADFVRTEKTRDWWSARPARKPPATRRGRGAGTWQLIPDGERQFLKGPAEGSSTRSPATTALLEALALAEGRGIPRADGVWRIAAEALAEGPPVTESDIGELLAAAGKFITADHEDGQVVYRLTNPLAADALLTDVGERVGLKRRQLARLRHGQLSRALLGNFSHNPYLVKRLPWHIARGDQWDLLAGHRPVRLDYLDARAIADAMLQMTFMDSRLAPEIAETCRSWPALAEGSAEVRGIARRMWGAGKMYRNGFRGHHDRWRLKWVALSSEPAGASPPGIPLGASTGQGKRTPLSAIASVRAGAGESRIVAARRDGTLTIWSPTSLDPLDSVEAHDGVITAAEPVTLPDGRTLLTTASGTVVKIWDPGDMRAPVQVFSTQRGAVQAVTTMQSQGGRRTLLVIANDEGGFRVWDPLTGQPESEPVQGHQGRINAITALPRNHDKRRFIATAGEDGKVMFWDQETLLRDRTNIRPRQGELCSLAVLAVGAASRLAIGYADGGIGLWDLRTRRQFGETLRGHQGNVRALAAVSRLDKEKRALLVSGDSNGTVQLWDGRDGKALGAPMTGHDGPVTGITSVHVLTGDAGSKNLIATSGGDPSPRVWNIPYAEKREEARGAPCHATVIASADAGAGEMTLLAGRTDGAVGLLDPVTGHPVAPALAALNGPVTAMAIVRTASGATRLVTSGGRGAGILRFWDLDNAQIIAEVDIRAKRNVKAVKTITAIAYPGESAHIVTGHADGAILFWDAEDGKRIPGRHCFHDQLTCMTAVPRVGAPTLLATGGGDGELRIWDPRTRQEWPPPLTERLGRILSLGILRTADGRTLLAVGRDDRRPIELFDTYSWELADTVWLDKDMEFRHLAGLPAGAAEYLIAVGADRIDTLHAGNGWRVDSSFVLADEALAAHAFGSGLAVATRTGLSLLELTASSSGVPDEVVEPLPLAHLPILTDLLAVHAH